MKKNNLISIIWMSTIIITIIGATFSYYSTVSASNSEAVNPKSSIFGIDLVVLPLYADKPLIPLNDEDVMTAYQNECVDIYEYGACKAYEINILSYGDDLSYNGTIEFNSNKIENLKYMILDEDDNPYVDITDVEFGTIQTLGDEFSLSYNERKRFKLIIWVPNYNYDQNDADGAGSFSASISYVSTGDNKITGTISGS